MEGRPMISSSSTGRPSVSFNVRKVDTAPRPMPRERQGGNSDGSGTLVFNAALGCMTPPARSSDNVEETGGLTSVAVRGDLGNSAAGVVRVGTRAGSDPAASPGLEAPTRRKVPKILPRLSHWERHSASDSASASTIGLLCRIAQSIHGRFSPPSETDAAQRELLIQQTETLVDDLISCLASRMAQLLSEVQASFASFENDTTEDWDIIGQRLCDAMASVEWILCCGSLAPLRREIYRHVQTQCLGKAYANTIIPRPDNDRESYQVWDRAITCVESIFASAREVVIHIGAAASAASLIGSPNLRQSWISLGEVMGKCASWIAVDRGGYYDIKNSPSSATALDEATLDQGGVVTLVLDVLGAKATGVFPDDRDKAFHACTLFIESFNNQYFGDMGRCALGSEGDETIGKEKRLATIVLGFGCNDTVRACLSSLDVESIGVPHFKPLKGQKRQSGGPRQFESVFSTGWNSTGKYFAMCTALGMMLRQQIRPGRIPVEKLLTLEDESKEVEGGGGGIEGCFGQVSRRVVAAFAGRVGEQHDAADVDLIDVFVHSSEKWVHHFTKRSSVLAANISARMPLAIAAASKPGGIKAVKSLSQIRAQHIKLVDDCCVCFMDVSRLLSKMQTKHPGMGRLSRLEGIRSRLYLVIVRSSAGFGLDTEASVRAIASLSKRLSQCRRVDAPGGDPDVLPASGPGVNVRMACVLLMRSVVESIVTQLRSLLVSRNTKTEGALAAATAHAAILPCVEAALARVGAPQENLLAKELLRGLAELAECV